MTHLWSPSWTLTGVGQSPELACRLAPTKELGKMDNFPSKWNSLEEESRTNLGIDEIYLRLSFSAFYNYQVTENITRATN